MVDLGPRLEAASMSLEEIAQSLGTVGLRGALTDWHFIGDIAAALFSIGFIVWVVIVIAKRLH